MEIQIMNFGGNEEFHCQRFKCHKCDVIKIYHKMYFLKIYGINLKTAFIQILRRAPSNGILIYPTLLAAKLKSSS